MYKKYLHTVMSKYCCNVVLLLCCIFSSSFIFKTLHRAVFMSRQNTTFSSKVGKMGVGEQGISRMGPCSPTPVSPTLGQKVAFRLLIKNIKIGIKATS